MSTKNTESSAVNHLIELASQQEAFARNHPAGLLRRSPKSRPLGQHDGALVIPPSSTLPPIRRRADSVPWWDGGLEDLEPGSDRKTSGSQIVGVLITLAMMAAMIGGYYFAVERAWLTPSEAATFEAAISAPITTDVLAPAPMDQPVNTAPAAKPESVAAVAAPASISTPVASAVASVPAGSATPPSPAVEPARAVASNTSANVEVLIESNPSGAAVVLVDRGKSSFLGSTPLSASVDPTRRYELIFTAADKPAQLAPFDPSTTKHVKITLGNAADPNAEPAPKKREKTTAKEKTVSTSAKAAAPTPAKAARTARDADAAGVLMISSKPPCLIAIDGKPTGLTTPQRSIPLSAGRHQITLVNSSENIKKTIVVQITADQTTKLIRNFME